jgi:hypothetical protein
LIDGLLLIETVIEKRKIVGSAPLDGRLELSREQEIAVGQVNELA